MDHSMNHKEKIIRSHEYPDDPANNYRILAENHIAAFGYDPDAEKNKYAVFPKSSSGEIIINSDNISFGLYADDILSLNLNSIFSLEEIMNINLMDNKIESQNQRCSYEHNEIE